MVWKSSSADAAPAPWQLCFGMGVTRARDESMLGHTAILPGSPRQEQGIHSAG